MSRHMYVTLTATDNQYLTPNLPLAGFIELFEMGNNGTIISGVFRVENKTKDGLIGGPVSVGKPQFAYTGEPPSHETREALYRSIGK